MPSEPLQPFAPPSVLGQFPGGAPTAAGTVLVWFFYLVLAVWLVYTLVAIYHWIKYSHAARIAVPAIALHLFVSFALASYALSGIFAGVPAA